MKHVATLWIAITLLVVGCTDTGTTTRVFDPLDLVLPTKPKDPSNPNAAQEPYAPVFDRTNFMDDVVFADTTIGSRALLERFFQKTAYGRASFLENYSSNGSTAAEALYRSSLQYRINPLVLLAILQLQQGLVSAGTYPMPTTRVEFALDCGCNSKGTCDPAFAGLDRQIECVAGSLRRRYDAIDAQSRTAGGWGPGQEALSLDGLRFTPTTKSTCAFYDMFPVVGAGDRGASLFWTIFSRFAQYVQYPLSSSQSG